MILGAWGISFLVDMLPYEYNPPGPVHALMMVLATATLGGQALSKRNSGE